eukprot:6044090-Pyramimonas_sp.AAC.1
MPYHGIAPRLLQRGGYQSKVHLLIGSTPSCHTSFRHFLLHLLFSLCRLFSRVREQKGALPTALLISRAVARPPPPANQLSFGSYASYAMR